MRRMGLLPGRPVTASNYVRRRIGRWRLLRPLVAAAVIIPLFVAKPVGSGTGPAIEIAGAPAGLLAGLAVVACLHVYRHPRTRSRSAGPVPPTPRSGC